MKRKLFLLVIILSFTFDSIVLAAPFVIEKEKELVIYDKEGNIVAIESEGSPLETKRSGEKANPEIERAIDAVVVDSNGKEVKKFYANKKKSNETIGTMAVGAKVATIAIAADEEYQSAHSDWVTKTRNLVEEMDDAFNRDHSFDLDIKVFIGWN